MSWAVTDGDTRKTSIWQVTRRRSTLTFMARFDVQEAEARHSLTRSQVADRLGISISSVRRLEYVRLHPVQDARGIYRFDPAELEDLEPQRSARARSIASDPHAGTARRESAKKGRLAARVFVMFAHHMALPQIVVATKQPPELIRELFHEWSTTLDMGEWSRQRAADQ